MFFLFLHKHVCCDFSLEPSRRDGSSEKWGELPQNYPENLTLIEVFTISAF